MLLVALAIGVGGVVISLVVTLMRDWRRRFLLFANRSDLRVSDEIITTAVIRRLRRTDVGSAIGCLIGLLVSVALIEIAHPVDTQFFLWVAIPPVLLLCQTAGALASSLTDELFVPMAHSPRIARSSTVSVRDYMSPARFWLVPVLLFAALMLLLAGFVLSGLGLIDSSRFLQGWAIWAVPTAALFGVGGAIAAHVVIQRDQPASDSLELAWSDALRADVLRNLWVFEGIVVWLALLLTGISILRALHSPIELSWASLVLSLAGNFGIIVLGLVFNYGVGQSYFRYRLWPDLGDVGEIVEDSDEDVDDADVEVHRP